MKIHPVMCAKTYEPAWSYNQEVEGIMFNCMHYITPMTTPASVQIKLIKTIWRTNMHCYWFISAQ